ncbi:hypothetical protein V6N12_025423 [Hibiscus sabdariffa]|uniref:RNA helicase n=1 Tax=Hibiscus sabdariffa TaxID=183260 RepID=A0ABR2CIE7_9ROSI
MKSYNPRTGMELLQLTSISKASAKQRAVWSGRTGPVASYKCSDAVISIAAMLSVGSSIFYRPKDKRVHADNARNNFHTGNVGDVISLMKVYNAWRETNFSTQWCYEKYIQVAEIRSLPDYEVSTDYLYTYIQAQTWHRSLRDGWAKGTGEQQSNLNNIFKSNQSWELDCYKLRC